MFYDFMLLSTPTGSRLCDCGRGTKTSLLDIWSGHRCSRNSVGGMHLLFIFPVDLVHMVNPTQPMLVLKLCDSITFSRRDSQWSTMVAKTENVSTGSPVSLLFTHSLDLILKTGAFSLLYFLFHTPYTHSVLHINHENILFSMFLQKFLCKQPNQRERD